MRILITGASGFLGSEISRRAIMDGHAVTALVRPSSDLSRLEGISSHPDFSLVVIPNSGVQSEFLEDSLFEVDVTIHSATSYGRSNSEFSDVSGIVESNLIFPMNVLRRTSRNGSKLFINTDSYFNKPGLKYSALLDYSTTKKFFAEWAFDNKFLQNVATLRLEHVYGPNDSNDKFVPKLLAGLVSNNEERFALSPGDQLRDFIHVKDVAEAFILAANQLVLHSSNGEQGRYWEYEIGTSQQISIRDFAERVKSISGSTTELGFGDIPVREDEISRSVATTRFADEFGFVPKYSLDQGIRSIIEALSES